MGKKVVVDKKIKKKKGCLRGCLTSLLTFVIIIGVLFGVACGVGNHFSKQYLGLGIFDCFGIVGDVLHNPKKSKVVTNPYSAEDAKAFEGEIKKQLFLKESTQIDLDKLLKVGTDAINPVSNNNNKLLSSVIELYGKYLPELNTGENGEGESPEEGVAGGFDILGFIADIFKKENIDIARLKNYDPSNHSANNFVLSDKEVAALVNSLINDLVLKIPAIQESLTQFGITNTENLLSLDQLIFTGKDRMVGGASKKIAFVTLTASISIDEIIDNFLEVWMSRIAKLFLPNRYYLTVEMSIDPSFSEVNLKLNDLNEKSHERVFTAVKNLTTNVPSISGGTTIDLKAMLDDIGVKITEQVVGFTKFIDLEKIQKGAIEFDVFQTIIDVAGLNADVTEPEDILTAPEIVSGLQGILTSDANAAINPDGTWQDQYTDGKEVYYKPADITDLTLVDYKKEFLNEISKKYLIDLSGKDKIEGTEDDITFEEILKLFGIGGESAAPDIMSLFDSARLKEILGIDPSLLKVNLTDRMLGAIINSQISTILGADSAFAAYSPTVEQVMITKEADANQDIHTFIEIGLSIKTESLLSGEGIFFDLLRGLFPEKIMLAIKLDISPELNDGQFLPTQIAYNDLSFDKTLNLLDLIKKFGIDFSVETILGEVEKPVRDMIKQMSDIIPGLSFVKSAIVLPSVFDTISDMVFTEKDAEGNKTVIVSGAEVQNALKGLTIGAEADYENKFVTNKAATDYSDLVRQMELKYYLNLGESKTFDDIFNKITTGMDFNKDNFNLMGKNGLFYDNKSASELTPIFSDREIAALIKEKMSGDGSSLSKFAEILEITIDNNKNLIVKIKVNVSDLFVGDNASIVPVDVLYITASVDTKNVLTFTTPEGVEKSYYKTSLSVNDMTENEFNVLVKMLDFINKDNSSAFDLTEKAIEIGEMIFSQMDTMKTSVGGDIEFVEGGIKLISFYDFLKSALSLENADPSDIKAAIQGLYEDNNDDIENVDNYKTSEIIYNEIDSGDFNIISAKTDKQLGSVVGKALADSVSSAELAQFNVFAKNRLRTADDDRLNTFDSLKQLKTDTTYFTLTFKMSIEADPGSQAAEFMPPYIFITFVYEVGTSGELLFKFYRINELTNLRQDILSSMLKLDIDNAQISDLMDKVSKTAVLGQIAKMNFVETADRADGIGEVKIIMP